MTALSPGPVAAAAPIWRFSWGFALLVAAAGALSLLPFWEGLSLMVDWWLGLPEFSHGILIPPLAAFLVWQHKDSLEKIRFNGNWWSLALVLLGGAVLVMGQLGTVYTLVQIAYVITLYGLILSLVGWSAFRLLTMPLLILVFMIPLPQFVLANLSTKLQLLSSQIGVAMIRWFDISVLLEGNVIDLGSYQLEVAEACSGLRYLLPLMVLGFLMAYIYKGAFWKRLVIFLSSIPLTVLMNSFRVAVIGVTVEYWGIQMAEGSLHDVQGWMLFMVSGALMLGEVAVLNLIGRHAGAWRDVFAIELPPPSPSGAVVQYRRPPASFIAAVLLLAVFAATAHWLPHPAEAIPERDSFSDFPQRFGPWQGQRDSLDAASSDQLKLDDYLLANYRSDHDGVVNLYISWYNSQRKGESVHSPRACLPGGGWQIHGFGQRQLPGVLINGQPLTVNRTVVELGNQRELVYYWFMQRGRIIDNELAVKWYLFWDALTRHRTDGAMVRLITVLPTTGDVDSADQRMAGFAAAIAPELTRYIPN